MNSRRLLLALGLCCTSSAGPSEPTAASFMRETVENYRSMSSYQDRGRSVQTLKLSPVESDPGTATVDFATAFKRPNKFRFSWTTTFSFDGNRAPTSDEIGSDGSKVWSWSSTDSVPEAEETMGMAVAGATGVTHGAAHQILRLLTDDVHGFRIDQLARLKIRRTDTLNGIRCYVLRGFKSENEVELWIGEDDHLIREAIETRPDSNTNTIEFDHIVINQDIPDGEFGLHGSRGD